MGKGWIDYLELGLGGLALSSAALAYLLSVHPLEFCAIVVSAIAFGMLLARRLSDSRPCE